MDWIMKEKEYSNGKGWVVVGSIGTEAGPKEVIELGCIDEHHARSLLIELDTCKYCDLK